MENLISNKKSLFITGIDTDIGKTIVSSWICLHTKFPYYKPIQTGAKFFHITKSDSDFVKKISGTKIIKEAYELGEPLSPFDAFLAENLIEKKIENNIKKFFDLQKILNNPEIKNHKNIIIEGAGGALVPISFTHDNKKFYMADLIFTINSTAIIVTNLELGFLNKTIMTVETLQKRNVKILGMIVVNFLENECEIFEKNEENDNEKILKNKNEIYNTKNKNNIQNNNSKNKINQQLIYTLEQFSSYKVLAVLNIQKNNNNLTLKKNLLHQKLPQIIIDFFAD